MVLEVKQSFHSPVSVSNPNKKEMNAWDRKGIEPKWRSNNQRSTRGRSTPNVLQTKRGTRKVLTCARKCGETSILSRKHESHLKCRHKVPLHMCFRLQRTSVLTQSVASLDPPLQDGSSSIYLQSPGDGREYWSRSRSESRFIAFSWSHHDLTSFRTLQQQDRIRFLHRMTTGKVFFLNLRICLRDNNCLCTE